MRYSDTNSITMKTAISLNDDLMHEADQAATKLGLSRSGLVAQALEHYLRHLRQQQVTEQLNKVYSDEPPAEDRQLTALMKRKFKTVIRDQW